MGTYKLNADELAEAINDVLDFAEGDFDMSELEKAFDLVRKKQSQVELAEKGEK